MLSIKDGYIYNAFVEKNDLTRNMGEFIRTSTKIEPKHVEEQLFFVSKHPYNVISSKVVEAYKNGEIVLLYSAVKMPFSLPFLISKNNNGPMAIVFISSYSRYVEATDTLDISAVNLYSLLEGAYINLKLTSSNRMEQNLPLMKTVNDVYINMLGNIFDREFVLNLNIPLRNKVRYTLSRFFYDKIVGLKNREVSHNLSYNSLKDPDKDEIDRLKEQYEDYLESNKIQNIVGLIKFINTIDSKLSGLTASYFLDKLSFTYSGTSVVMVEYLPYIMFTIILSLNGSFLVNIKSLNEIVKNARDIRYFYNEISKLI